MSEICCAITITESTGALLGIRTPGPDLPAEGVDDELDTRMVYLTEANLPEEACKDWMYFHSNYWFDKTNMTFVKVGIPPNEYATWNGSAWTWDAKLLEADIRRARTGRLIGTDWTQIPDNSLTEELRAEARTYRQALRDFMPNIGSPTTIDDVDWPEPPSFLQ